jgi:membrane-associated phospholipid phosphatase
LVACVVLSGLLVDALKLVVGRMRPRALNVGSVWDSFIAWLPVVTIGSSGGGTKSDIQSFPSGHTATAVGLAVGLSAVYPRGWWLFASFAALAATQRIESGAHYVTDTFAAASLAFLVCASCFDRRFLGRWFDRIEDGAAAGT